MNLFALLLLLVTGSGILFGSRIWGMASFLVGCCYMTAGEGLVIGGFNFPVFRMLLLLGVIRVAVEGKGLVGGINRMDKVMLAWAVWLMIASCFHEWTPGSGPKFTAGAVFNVVALYLMVRSFCVDATSLDDLFGILCWLLVPVAVLMVVEQVYHKNLFAVFGGIPEEPLFRNGRYRAQGPFEHAILAGTIGAGCIPLVLATWRQHRLRATIGLAACLVMVVTSASSGPIMSTIFVAFALALWWRRSLARLLVRAAIPAYLVLAVFMERPPYYLISKIDLTGASTGWHRCFLIEQTFNHFDEWWLFGTDRTRHWMPSQGRISEIHTDITNQYIAYGVNGGFLGMVLVIVLMAMTFRTIGRMVEAEGVEEKDKFLFWCIGASLFAHAASAISIAYFGQALFFFWLPVACMASFRGAELRYSEEAEEESEDLDPEDTESRRRLEGPVRSW